MNGELPNLQWIISAVLSSTRNRYLVLGKRNGRGHSVHDPTFEAISIRAGVVCVPLMCAGSRWVSLVCSSNERCRLFYPIIKSKISTVVFSAKSTFTAFVPCVAILSPYLV